MWKQVVGGLHLWKKQQVVAVGCVVGRTCYSSHQVVGVRNISRNREPRNLRKIDLSTKKVVSSFEEATDIAQRLYNLIRQHGPLTVSNTWTLHHSHQEAGVSGLKSKTHMKLMLKWMRGRNMLKLFCNQVGASKKFLHCTLPEDPQTEQSRKLMELKLHSVSPKRKNKKQQQTQ